MATCAIHKDQPDLTCHVCHAAALATKYAEEGRIELASQVLTDVYHDEVEQVLVALGHPEALVTDESCISDFDVRGDEWLALSKVLGVPINRGDYILDVAKRLRSKPPHKEGI